MPTSDQRNELLTKTIYLNFCRQYFLWLADANYPKVPRIEPDWWAQRSNPLLIDPNQSDHSGCSRQLRGSNCSSSFMSRKDPKVSDWFVGFISRVFSFWIIHRGRFLERANSFGTNLEGKVQMCRWTWTRVLGGNVSKRRKFNYGRWDASVSPATVYI